MKIINIVFYVFGIALPIIIIFYSLIKSNNNKKIFILKNLLIAGIIFLLFYFLKLGGVILIEKSSSKNEIKTSNLDNIKNTTKSITTTKNNENTETVSGESDSQLKYVDGILIVNKSYSLPKDYVPTNTYKSAQGLRYCSECLDITTYEQYKKMEADVTSLGMHIWIQSGYRSYELQQDLYNGYVERDGKLAADTYSARPGHSEHQTGLAFDLNSISDDFQYTNEGKWIHDNAWRYGFILRYPKGKEEKTGYKYESWHLRYVGIDLATELYNNGDWITLEEHFNLPSKYSD